MEMTDKNRNDGYLVYKENGTIGDRDWFHRQWTMWPKRADTRLTTNLSFHHGGVMAYREIHGTEPEMSLDMTPNIAVLDGFLI